jgi:hypothetical protein
VTLSGRAGKFSIWIYRPTLKPKEDIAMPTSANSRFTIAIVLLLAFCPLTARAEQKVGVTETDDAITIETDALSAIIRKTGYVSGVKAGSFIDKKTGAHDLGFGLHIQDWLMAPGWREDGYPRDPKLHGNLPKHIVEGPQLCTQAKVVTAKVIRGEGFAAVLLGYTYTKPGPGFKAGSTWEQTLIFQPGVRYFLSAERITSVNDADDLFYRLDMPGHIKHKGADTFEQVYLSYLDKMIPASAFSENFGPDEKFLYRRRDDAIPRRMIRAYQVKLDGKPGPWLAGMTLDPAETSEAWCHERGYVCFIEELHRRHVNAGESFGAAYCIGWFDDVTQMQNVYDRYKGAKRIVVAGGKFNLEK